MRMIIAAVDSVPLEGVLGKQSRLIWEHNGECGCGRRTYLSGQCMKCLQDDLSEKRIQEKEVALAGEEPHAPETLQDCPTRRFPYPGASAGLLPELQFPQVSTGAEKASVRFINCGQLKKLARSTWRGRAVLSRWDINKDFKIPSSPLETRLYRISL